MLKILKKVDSKKGEKWAFHKILRNKWIKWINRWIDYPIYVCKIIKYKFAIVFNIIFLHLGLKKSE